MPTGLHTMDIRHISRRRFTSTVLWALVGSIIVVGGAAALGRAAINIEGALTEKPDIAIYLLLPDEGIGRVTVLREREDERHYLAETKSGPKLIILKKGETEWYVERVEPLRE